MSEKSEKPEPPDVAFIKEQTIQELNETVGEYYRLMKAGKNPDKSPEAAAALKKFRDVVEGKLHYDNDDNSWSDK